MEKWFFLEKLENMKRGKLENYKSGKVENKKSIKLENCTYKYLYILIHIPIQSSIYPLYIPRQYWSFAHFKGGGPIRWWLGWSLTIRTGSAIIAKLGAAMIVVPASHLAVPPSNRHHNPFVTRLIFKNLPPVYNFVTNYYVIWLVNR